ncbi:class I SAM-dependent methyltransferase [Mycobacterium asiaticum]|uniref:class I SAM-dependent methyltransferase n=1 Tax=Mycobacterium asiaticum TaxID=1790 RepID=UPI000AF0555E|nr:class I SAM-dependent methyltransferase [Mycobacterium asiaticum]
MPDPVTERPTICLNMIVRNEAHIVHEVLDAVAPYISSWVIVDTGSDDGTQDLIRRHMAGLGIPGELHERPWRNFGHNRTEALDLAQGHADYIWVIDADDTVVGSLELSELTADIYSLRHAGNEDTYWRPQIFRDGVRVHYEGVVHEHAAWDYASCVDERVEGDYHIDSRRLGARNLDPEKYARDRDILLAELDRKPGDVRSVFYLAQSYFDMGDFVNARKWYARRAEMGDWEEEVYYSLYRVAESMAQLGEPWAEVQDAYLRAWEFRPTRAEPLHAVARHYREEQRYRLGYQFAQQAADIPFPDEDRLFVRRDIYAWRAKDEQAVCASWIGKHPEAFTLCRQLLVRPELPDHDRQRIAGNRDVCVPTMIEAAFNYPDTLIQSLPTTADPSEITISLTAGPELHTTEQTLNSFLHCCTDLCQAGRFLILDTGLTTHDRTTLQQRYPFAEFLTTGSQDSPGAHLMQLRTHINTRFWLHLPEGWQFFAPDNLLTRLTAVLNAEPHVCQVGINYTDATKLTGTCATEDDVHRTPDAGRYLLTDTAAHGPAMFDTTRCDITRLDTTHPEAGLHTATLDEVLCISGPGVLRELPWTASASDIINGLLTAAGSSHFVELSIDGPSACFGSIMADSKISVSYHAAAHHRLDEDFLQAESPEGGYDVIFLDTWREPKHMLDIIERCLPKLSATGALVVDGTSPPAEWHRRLTGEHEPEAESAGQVRQAVIEFRVLHPQIEVLTVEASWGCAVIRPNRRAQQALVPAVDTAKGAAYEREHRLLNLVSVAWFRRHIHAEPYLDGSRQLAHRTQLLNVLISINGLDSYLEIGIAGGDNFDRVIAPIRHSVDPHPEFSGAVATYPMPSDEFFASGLGLERYDLIFIDGLHTEDQCRRDLENALGRLSDRGWIVAHDANPPTEWHQRPLEEYQPGSEWNGTVWKALVRFRSAHPELDIKTLDLDWGCAVIRRRTEKGAREPYPPIELPETLEWAFLAEHRRELLNLVTAAPEELPGLLSASPA